MKQKWFKTYVISLRKDIRILLLLDVAFVILMEVLRQLIPGFDASPLLLDVFNICLTLALSILAAGIFFFIQVYMPEIKKKENIYPCVAELFYSIISREHALDNDMRRTAPMFLGEVNRNATWREYLLIQIRNIDDQWGREWHCGNLKIITKFTIRFLRS